VVIFLGAVVAEVAVAQLPIATHLLPVLPEPVAAEAEVVVDITTLVAARLEKLVHRAQAPARMTALQEAPVLALPLALAGQVEPASEILAALADLAEIGVKMAMEVLLAAGRLSHLDAEARELVLV